MSSARAALLHLLGQHEDERRRIARALHDDAAQATAALALELAALGDRAGATDPATAAALARCRALADDITASIRTACAALHPPLLDETGPGGALRAQIASLAREGGPAVRLAIEEPLPPLPAAAGLAAVQAVRAALAVLVARRHDADAAVTLGPASRGIAIVITGRRHPRSGAWRSPRVQPAALVLAGSRERVRQLGGTLRTGTDAGATRIRVWLPAARRRRPGSR